MIRCSCFQLSAPLPVQSPYSIVTALLDRTSIRQIINPDEDIKLSGHVTWVGKSSAESTLNVHQRRRGKREGGEESCWEKVMEARFVLVARDALNQGKAIINPLIAETPEEKALLEQGKGNCYL